MYLSSFKPPLSGSMYKTFFDGLRLQTVLANPPKREKSEAYERFSSSGTWRAISLSTGLPDSLEAPSSNLCVKKKKE